MKNSIYIFLLFFGPLIVSGQYVINDFEEIENLESLSQEKVYMSTSSDVVFPGEYVYYNFYCLETQKNRLSSISSIGYVTLVGPDAKQIWEQKLALTSGKQQGDFFVPTDWPTGNYKLIGYTNWMKNVGQVQYFIKDIYVINPYKESSNFDLLDSNASARLTPSNKYSNTKDIGLLIDAASIRTRKKISFTLKNYKGYLGNGSYTIKVLKEDKLINQSDKHAIDYKEYLLNAKKKTDFNIGDSIALPEQKGELFYGKINNLSEFNDKRKTVTVSFPGQESILKYATSNNKGYFYTYVKKPYKINRVIVQPLNPADTLSIQLGRKPLLKLENLKFNKLKVFEESIEEIRQRSIYNQIENQFFQIKPDSILVEGKVDPFDGGQPEIYYLDNYTRFKTFEETLVEIMNNAGYRTSKDGPDYIRLSQDFEKVNETYNNYPAIVLLDGVFIPNHEVLKDYEAGTIKSISLIRDQFSIADKMYQGIMAITTFEGDFFQTYKPAHGVNLEIQKVLEKKEYFKQDFKNDKAPSGVPDYRRLLLWEPNIELDKEELQFSFYTSDVKGKFSIIIDGFTTYGKPIYLREDFLVE